MKQRMLRGIIVVCGALVLTTSAAAQTEPESTTAGTTFSTDARPAQCTLVAHWAGEGDATDATGNGHDGTLNGDMGFAAGVDGGQAFDFTDGFVEVPDVDFVQPCYRIHAWFRTDGNGKDMAIVTAIDKDDPRMTGGGTVFPGGVTLEIQGGGGDPPGELRYVHRFPVNLGGPQSVFSGASLTDGE